MLALDVEYLLGVCFAARRQSDPEPDWPPQIDRVFSALTATWAARGEREDERRALEWLERQSPPLVHATQANARMDRTVYVPPNDARGVQLQALPARRRRQERRFPAAIPHEPITSYTWPHAEPEPEVFSSLQALAGDTAYLGHSSSVVRCWFRQVAAATDAEARPGRKRIYPGRLNVLETAFRQGRRPPLDSLENEVHDTDTARRPASVFGREWHIFADAGGYCPDLLEAAVAGRALRTALMSGFRQEAIPEVISGHTPEGAPSSKPHMAIFPLANVGWTWADGRLMGIAVCLPRDVSRSDEDALFDALAEIMRSRGSPEHGEIEVDLPGGKRWRLVRQAEPALSSLKPYRYTQAARIWATATPIALDRHPKAEGNQARQDEIAVMISDACTRIGLPRPTLVVPDKHSAIRGTPPAVPSPKSPPHMRWSLPGPLKGRVLTHATLVFDEPVEGPIALGAGRFIGLGLCLPLHQEKRT